MKSIARITVSRGRLPLVALSVGVAVVAFAVQALGSFGKPRHFAAGTGPTSVAIADLNGDGKRDLAVANSGSSNVSVLLGNGGGGFGKARNFAAPTAPQSVAIGDLNSDGNPDLAVAGGSDSVSVLLGDGKDGFGAATSFPVGRHPSSVAIGDLNRDGNLDVAVANSGSSYNSISVLLGDGTGGLWATPKIALGSGPNSVAIGDLSGDGNPDLAVARRGSVVSVLLGTGNGAFEAALNFVVGLNPSSLVISDLNGDGNRDLAVANNGSYDRQPSTVSILLGNGEGNFRARKNFAAGYHPYSIAIGDFNRDGKRDLAVSNETVGPGFAHVSILLGKGGGGFGAPRHLRVGSGFSGPGSVAVGKLDGGPYPDLAVALSNSGNVSVLLNGGPGR